MTNSRLNDGSAINPSDHDLYDSETNERVGTDDLGCSAEDYADAIRESFRCSHEGHVLVRGRRVYAR